MSKIQELYNKYIDNTISADELKLFWQLVAKEDDNAAFWNRVFDEYKNQANSPFSTFEQPSDGILETVFSENAVAIEQKSKTYKSLFVAALVAILGVFCFYLYDTKKSASTLQTAIIDIQHLGKGKAILAVSGEKSIDIDSIHFQKNWDSGFVQTQINNGIVTNLLFSHRKNIGSTSQISIRTESSRNVEVQLSDGTKVWLNANSELRFPNNFAASSRDVYLSGEGYFEVAKKELSPNRRLPFVVHLKNKDGEPAEINVLGTHFNVKNYKEDKSVICTLLEGLVEYRQKGARLIIKPGQQILVSRDAKISDSAHVDNVIAWKNGQIMLEQESIKSLLNEISRWYNVHIQYETEISNVTLNGVLDRNIPLEDVLNVLVAYGIHCRLAGNTIYVRN